MCNNVCKESQWVNRLKRYWKWVLLFSSIATNAQYACIDLLQFNLALACQPGRSGFHYRPFDSVVGYMLTKMHGKLRNELHLVHASLHVLLSALGLISCEDPRGTVLHGHGVLLNVW